MSLTGKTCFYCGSTDPEHNGVCCRNHFWCGEVADHPFHVQRGADTPQPETAEITNRWLENHLYVDPSYVGAWCEHITHVTLDGYGSARCNKRPSEHVSAVPYTTEIAQSAVRGADVPATEPAAEGALAQCWDCDLHLPKAEMRRIDTTSGWQWQCAACQPSAGASPTEPADVATEPAVGLERGVDAATQLAAGGSATPAERGDECDGCWVGGDCLYEPSCSEGSADG